MDLPTLRLACLLVIGPLLLGGCQTHRAHPPDLDAHAAAWEARRADADSVRRFAASLARLDPVPRADFDLSDGLSLPEAEAAALVLNPALRVARLDARVPALGLREAGRPQDPSLELDVLRIAQSVSSPWILATGLQFSIPVSGRLAADKRHAASEVDVARCRVLVQERELVLALHQAWNEWTAAEESAGVLTAHIALLDAALPVAEAQREADQIGAPELRILTLERLKAEGKLAAVRARAAALILALKRQIGLAPQADITFVPGFAVDAPSEPGTGDEARLRERSAALALARALHARAERALDLEIRKQAPDVGIGPDVAREDGTTRLGGGVSLPLPLWNKNRRAIAEHRADRDAKRAAVHAAYESLVADAAAARQALTTAATRATWIEERWAPETDAQLADVRALGKAGDMDVLLWKDAITGALEAKQALLAARLAEAQAAARVQSLIDPLETPGSRCCLGGGAR